MRLGVSCHLLCAVIALLRWRILMRRLLLRTVCLVLGVTDVPRGSTKHVRFTEEAAIQDLRECAEKILAIRESEELAEEAVRLGRMVSSDTPLY